MQHSSKKKILVVDEDGPFRTLLSGYLSAHAYEVETADNGLEALRMLRNGYYPDALIADIQTSGIDGFTLFQHLQTSAFFHKIPIRLIGDATTRRNHDVKGPKMYYKPFDLEELVGDLAKQFDKAKSPSVQGRHAVFNAYSG